MSSVKITNLPSSSVITNDDLFVVVNDPSGVPVTQRATAQKVLDYVTGTTFQSLNVAGNTSLSTVSASVVSASSYVGLPSTSVTPGGTDTNIQFNKTNTLSGSSNLIFNYSTNTLSGTTAQFTTITSSNITSSLIRANIISGNIAEFAGDVIIYGTAALDQNPASAYVRYDSVSDQILIFPDLKVSGSTVIEGNLTVTGIISGSSYLGVSGSGGSTSPGGGNTSIQFNSGSTFSGSSNLIFNYSTNTLSGTTAQFTTISASIISASSYVGPINNILIGSSVISGTNGSILFINSSTLAQNNTNLFWDNSNNRLGIGTTTPTSKIQTISSDGATYGESGLRVLNTTTTGIANITLNANNNPGASFFLSYYGNSSPATAWVTGFTPTSAADWANLGTYNSKGLLFTATHPLNPTRMAFSTIRPGDASNTLRMEIETNGAVVINQDGDSGTDFRVESQANQAALFVDASADRVGIGTLTPNSKLDVNGNTIISGNLNVTGNIAFTATNPSHWSGSAPTNLQDAINRIAAAIFSGLSGSIA